MGNTFFRNFNRVALRGRLSVLKNREDGFTLIEIMVSALIIVLISAGVAQALIASIHVSGNQRSRSQADEVAQQDQERMKGMSDQQLGALTQMRTVTLDGRVFTVNSTAQFLNVTGGSSCSNGVAAYYKLTSKVGWTDGSQSPSVTEEAIITRAVTGAILQQVKDQTGTGLSGVNVTVDGQNTSYHDSAATDSSGCTIITGLPTDSYAITLAAAGYVDKDGNASPPNASAAVSLSAVSTPPALQLGQAGSVNVQFQTGAATTSPLTVPGYELSYFGSLGGSHMTVFKTVGSGSSSASSFTASNLYPFWSSANGYANNYQLWAGKCEQEEPLQPPTGTNASTVTPGSTLSATVVEPAIDAAIKYNGALITPTDVHIAFTGTSGPACSDTWSVSAASSEQVGAVTYGVYPAPFASTAAQGTATASATGDTGTLTFCADYKTGPSSWKSETTSAMTTTNFTAPNASLQWDLKTDGASKTTACP